MTTNWRTAAPTTSDPLRMTPEEMAAVTDLISIRQAAARGIRRLRKPKWANPLDHLEIDIVDGRPGIWTRLFCPFNRECNGRDPVEILCFEHPLAYYEDADWEPYAGPLAGSDEYKSAQKVYEGILQPRA